MSRYLFTFIGGKYEGGQVALPDAGEVGIGRAQELGICLVEDMVSRHHAKIEVAGGQVLLTDLNSTNGTFVNGERIQKAEVEHDDRVLVGTSIMRLVDTQGQAAQPTPQPQQTAAAAEPEDLAIEIDLDLDVGGGTQVTAAAPRTESMSGDLADVPLTDLLQLLGNNQRTGEVRVDGVGEAYLTLRAGRLSDVRLAQTPTLSALKALCRVLRWPNGSFAFAATRAAEAGGADADEGRLTGRLEEVLMEATRQNDEAARLRDPLGGPELEVRVAQLWAQPLAALPAPALAALQLVHNHPGALDGLLNLAAEPDSDMLTALLALRDAGFVDLVDP